MSEGVRAKGTVAEVWQGESQVGVLWEWRLSGYDGEWEAEATRQSLSSDFTGGQCELRFCVNGSTGTLFQLRGEGELSGYVVGRKCNRQVKVRGSKLWTVTATLASI